MRDNIHYFSMNENLPKVDYELLGIRGKRAFELAQIKMPIVPGIIIDSSIASSLKGVNLTDSLKEFSQKLEKETGKIFNDETNPAIFKIVLSPPMEIVTFPSIHTIGLTDKTIKGFEKLVGEHFAYHEYAKFLIHGTVNVLLKTTNNGAELKQLESLADKIKNAKNISDFKKVIEAAKKILPKQFFQDGYYQLNFLLQKLSLFLKLEEMDEDDSAIMIQAMVYGNYGKDSYSGRFYTRDIVTGEKKLQGFCYQDKFDETGEGNELDINSISVNFKKELEKVADKIETYFKQIRLVKFTIEKGKFWVIEQSIAMAKSTQADLKCLLELLGKKVIDEKYLLNSFEPSQISEILHPVIKPASIKNIKKIKGGIIGAPGAARGRIYFNTERLIEGYQQAIANKQDHNVILCLPATYAEDVKGIEISTGVISAEGGYAAHASVVSRQYGKVSLVNTGIKIDVNKKQFSINGVIVKEGDYVSLDVPYYGQPQIILGKAELNEPDPSTSGLLDLIAIVNKYIKDFKVLGNADTPKDASLVRKFGGEGIGLCRTEHMFFGENRINVFRDMILSTSQVERLKVLKKLQQIQTKDFYEIFKAMNPYPVTIRLLDAPLHEFLPHTKDEMDDFLEYLSKSNPKIKRSDVEYKINMIAEVNPMLGHRGCRIAVTYPEIYEMQLSAIFSAAYKLREEGKSIVPEIMIPIVMNMQELKFIKNGKKIEGKDIKGILDTEEKVRNSLKIKNKIKYKVGTMIELPAAALSSAKIAQYAEFFSFGTNDLTQTTHGISRDDFNTFLPDYTKYDLLEANPFQVLSDPVRQLIITAVTRGRLTRPDLKIGLCGEQGADPRNLGFLRETGLNYVSCSSYSIPIAKLAIAQIELKEK